MKQAQLTLMIITGIIFVIAVGMVIWLGGKTAQRRIAPEAEQQRLRQVAVQPVKDYIQSCLDLTTSDVLELLGKQGLVLYKSQGGLTDDVVSWNEGSTHVVYDRLSVSYAILPPAGAAGQISSTPPVYPFRTFPYIFKTSNESAGEVVKMQFSGYYGTPRFPPLLKPGENSIQEQIESYIAYNLPRCTDWQSFEPQGLEIIADVPNVTMILAENWTQIETEEFFTILAAWNVNITDKTTRGATTIGEFSLSYPVHLSKFYLFVQGVVNSEVSDVSFDPRTATTQATPVTVVENVFINPDKSGDDIIIVQDTKSFLRGKPLEFRLLRKNRMPALFLINQTGLDKYKFYPALGNCANLESIFLSGNELVIKPGEPDEWHETLSALDPDEDKITFMTCPQTPAKIDVPYAGVDFKPDVIASDVGEVSCGAQDASKDWQQLIIHTTSCPPP